MTYALISAVAAAIAGALLTERFRRYAVRKGIRDVPNERSSHDAPTPRGGGVSIVLIVLGAALALAIVEGSLWAALLAGGGVAVAAVGWADDVGGVRAAWRLFVHAAASVLMVAVLRDDVVLWLAPGIVLEGAAAWLLAILFVVWSINSYNFMDGIDGIAAGQSASVCAVAAGLGYRASAPDEFLIALLVLAGASLGFLVHNWHPARVFMGDVSSGFIGYALALLGLWGAAIGAVPILAFLVLMSSFYVDATYTLARRLLAGERVYKAHRDHAYQHAVQSGRSHAAVSGAYIAINLFWLAPWAAVICWRPSWGPICAAVAMGPLVVGAYLHRAGIKLDAS